MDKFIKQLDPNLDYINHEINDGKCYITVASNRKEVTCPFCSQSSSRIHSTYNRIFQDLPIQGNKVFIIIRNRKMFCDNHDCSHTTFMDEPTSSLDPRSRRRVMELLKNFEHTKIITSHDLDMVLEICERTIVLKQGKVAADGLTSEILADKELMNTCGLEVPLALQGCPVCGEKKKYV